MKQYKMKIIDVSPEEMQKRVARFQTLKYPPNRYHDSQIPGNARKNYLVVGTGLMGDDPAGACALANTCRHK